MLTSKRKHSSLNMFSVIHDPSVQIKSPISNIRSTFFVADLPPHMDTFATVFCFLVVLSQTYQITARNCSSTEALKCFGGTCSCFKELRGDTFVNNQSVSCLAPICNCTTNGRLHIAARCKSISLRVHHVISHPEKVLSL